MTSILTNSTSMTALQALKAASSSLEATQGQVSTGLRISEASHNAAYWSIATTMRSDNMALSTVSDALGLGIARADIAYTALDSTVGLLSDFSAKVILAKDQPDNRAKIQTELENLKQQIASIATSANFNGANWLNTEHPGNLAELSDYKTAIVSSFVRSPEGHASIGKTDVNLLRTSLFNVGGGGALQADPRSLGDIGGLRGQSLNTNGAMGFQDFGFTGAVAIGDTEAIRFTLTLDEGLHAAGQTFDVVIDKALVSAELGTTDGQINTIAEMQRVLEAALNDAGAPAVVSIAGSRFAIRSEELTGESGSSVSVALTETIGGQAAGLENPLAGNIRDSYATTGLLFAGPFRVHNDVEFSFEIEVSGNTPVRITIDRAMVDAALGTTDGIVADPDQLAVLLDHALDGQGINVVATSNFVRLLIDDTVHPNAGSRSTIALRDVADNVGILPDSDLMDVDVSAPSALDNYISGLDGMLKKVMTAASELGALKKSLNLQADFAKSLSDSLSRGVGQLVDANMDKASTRLTALQTQQQLAIQSLQIANANPQSILQLFR
ncbi:flagellin N-terminal helical domain-containing protein [Aminobacter niigataensis]|uniref:flagellin N-terminal helical domain-containing protein n=1 Tax=Aminobacter niigataensis TaxID=83265 RepID=UPI00298F18AC|nr:flagellin [Aminobacter niigataensis]